MADRVPCGPVWIILCCMEIRAGSETSPIISPCRVSVVVVAPDNWVHTLVPFPQCVVGDRNRSPSGLAKTRALGEFSTNDFRHHSFSFFGNSSQVRALLVPCMRACVAELLKACPHVPPTPRESAEAQAPSGRPLPPHSPSEFPLNPLLYIIVHT